MAKIATITRKAQQVNIEIDKGSTFRGYLIWKTGDPLLPVDLTGWKARMQIRSTVTGATVVHEMTTEDGGIEITGVEGKVELIISADDSTAFDWESAVYGLELIDEPDTGDVRRLTYGDVEAFDEVTR